MVAAFLPGLPKQMLSSEVARLREAALTSANQVVALPGAKRLVAELPAHLWGIVTSNDRDVALARLRAVGLPEPDVLVAAEDVAKGKPDPEGYIKAAHLLGVKASEVVVVDDSPSGIEAAIAAGMTAITILGADKTQHSINDRAISVENLAALTAEVDKSGILLTVSLATHTIDSQPRPGTGVEAVLDAKPDKSAEFTRKRLDDVKWHLTRYDALRVSLASRGALILSADALIAAGSTVLAGQRISQMGSFNVAATLISVASLLSVGTSVTFAAGAIINVRPWRSSHKEHLPRSILFDASDTVAVIRSFEDFEQIFLATDDEMALRSAIVNLWKCITSYKHRYARLRKALQFLFAGLWIFLLGVALQFVLPPV